MRRCQQRRRHRSPARGRRWKRQPQRVAYSHASSASGASGLCCGDTRHAGDDGTGSGWGCSRHWWPKARPRHLVPATPLLSSPSCHPHPCHPHPRHPILSTPKLATPFLAPSYLPPCPGHPILVTPISSPPSLPPCPCHLVPATPISATPPLPPPSFDPIPATPPLLSPPCDPHPCDPIPATPIPVTPSPPPQPAGGRWPLPAPVPGCRAPCGGCAASAGAGACGTSSQRGATPVGGCRVPCSPHIPSLCQPGVLVTSATTTLPTVPAGDACSPASSTAPAMSTRQLSVTCQPWGQATSSLGGTAAPACIGCELSPGTMVPPHWWHPQCPCVTPHSRHRCWLRRQVPSPHRAAGSRSRTPPPAPRPGWPRRPAAAWGQGQAAITSLSPPAQRRVPRVLTASVAPRSRVHPSASPWGAGCGGGAAPLCR